MNHLQRYAWYAFVALLPWQTIFVLREVFVSGEKWHAATFGIFVSDGALFVCFVLLFIDREKRALMIRFLRRDSVAFFLGMFVLWNFFSVFWAIRMDMALIAAWQMTLFFVAFLVARTIHTSIRQTMLIFIISLLISAALAIGQFVVQEVSALKWLGIASHESWASGTSVVKTNDARWLRAYGSFSHPNIAGSIFAIGILLVFSSFVQEKSRSFRVFFVGVMGIFVFALLVSFSRVAWLGMLFGAGVWVLFFWNNWNKENRKKEERARCREIYGVFFVALFVGIPLFHSIIFPRFSPDVIAREGTISDRVKYVSQSLEMIREYPILGVGAGNFTAFTSSRYWFDGAYIGLFQPVHDIFLLVFAELGIVGFVLFLGIFFPAVSHFWKRKNMFALAIFGALLPSMVLDHWLLTSHFGVLLLGFLMGIFSREGE